ncbi:hypothetical protein GE061_014567 [Apolygus lucorum]|uniref:Calpain catalytic domain-containing protein n=1 Tax=Apolygus lucorum TaxID=248454 RepID=A0A8S9XLA7_APOLU|nr:hypothetical protein GE061_014567 [Apolygus lucorum]
MDLSPRRKARLLGPYREATYLAKKAIECDNNSHVDAAAFYYSQAARLLMDLAYNFPTFEDRKEWITRAEEYKKRAAQISVPKSPKQMKQPEMVMLSRCRFLLNQALDADEKGDSKNALVLYKEAMTATLQAMNELKHKPAFQAKLDNIMKEAVARVDHLKMKEKNMLTQKGAQVVTPKNALNIPHEEHEVVNDTNLKLSGKATLTEKEKKVILITSKINNLEFVPFMTVDYSEKFDYRPQRFTDRDGYLRLSPKQQENFHKWARPDELCDAPKMVAGTFIDCFSIKQTVISDCSFVASLSVAALYEKRFGRRLISNIIFPRKKNKEPYYNPSGKYMIKFHLNGIKRKVIIDDYLPVDKKGELLSSFSVRKGELWISLIEKAYMKVMGGYDFPGSNSNIDLHALTGWIPERIVLKPRGEPRKDADELFRMIMQRMKNGDALMTAATPDMDEMESKRAGLVALHAYAILDVRVAQKERLIQLKNPWSNVRWRGNYSELDVNHWTKQLCQELDYDPKNAAFFDNGVFWIDYKSLLHFFDIIYINWNPNMFTYTYTIHEEWSAGVGPAKDSFTVGENPQYRLKLSADVKTGAAWVLLTRHITDIEDFKYNKEYITMLIYANKGKRVYYPYEPEPVIDGARINSPHYLAKINLADVKGRDFTLVISQYEKTTTIYYSLRVYATSPFTLTPIIDPYKYVEKVIDGEWKGLTAGGCRNFPASYDNNPDYHLSLKGAGSICIELRAPPIPKIGFDVVPLNAEGPQQLLHSGDYRAGFVVLEVENLPEGSYSIRPTTFKPKEESRFLLTVKSTVPLTLKMTPKPTQT